MSNPSPSFARRCKWRLEWLVYLALETITGLFTARRAALLGARLGAVAGRLSKRHRRTVNRNLRIAFAGEKSRDEITALADEVFRRSGANLIASLRTATLSEARLNKAVDNENPEVMHAAMAAGRGVVVLLAHMGNWEALAQKFPQILPPGKAATMYRPLNNPVMDARVVATRKRTGLVPFAKGVNPMMLASYLRDGGCLGIISDQRAIGIGETVPFFGRMTVCTPLPAILARRTGAQVVAMSVKTTVPGKWSIKLHKLEGEPTTANCMRLLEVVMRESPADVFWLQDRWKVSRHQPQFVPGKTPRGSTGEQLIAPKKRRCLVWLDRDAAPVPALLSIEPDDLAFEYCVPAGTARPTWIAPDALVHTRPENSGKPTEAWTECLREIDASAALPLDFVYAPNFGKELGKAGREAGVVVTTQP
ncbi:lysophospholipid acyltransferase family protein [Rariglobus hedericola]|uniref:Lipid A biosynthesis acyltransferase n=1 Tax=Rariglobus hedericola TaxID=2597822 RepID=A0A556QP06_9BACT|nr:lipid A biosynthesis acyltransferase [Rariglobus hedericola]TSJ78332.1 lipid A biosynthesis acyltransferase [Rariglobus hedericola]